MKHLKTAGKYIRRSPYQALSATLIMTLTFFAISIFAVLTVISMNLINYFETRPQLTVFFKDTAELVDIDAMKTQLEATGKTAEVIYISKEEALEIYKNINKDEPELVELVTADILPASLEVQAQNPEDLKSLAQVVAASEYVDRIVFQEEIVDTLISWTNAFQVIGLGVIAILVTVSVFVIVTIIGIKITARREDIETMRLIGASNWFIRTPFLIEGFIYGVMGAMIGWLLSYGILVYTTPIFESFLKGVPIFPVPPLTIVQILGIELLVALLLGIFASYIAVLRYLK
ncbi:MAG TPA: permease-like cell division protein FtsX [Candidatus Levybacteria bacterium]|nr:permease-like cell division protein FtsX [Candidatus Levybacteria bacterium]